MYTPQTVYTAVIISYIIVGVIIAYFIASMIRHQRRNQLLHRRNILAEITTLEQERKRLSADLHDALGPTLSVVKFKIESVEVQDNEDAVQLQEASQQIDEILSRVRAISKNLMPATLVRKGVVAAVEEFLHSLEHTSPVKCHFTASLHCSLDQEKYVHLYRVIQEITNNTLRHAVARNLVIHIEENPEYLEITCQDDGMGFDYPTALEESSGLGLRNIQSRIDIMGGKLKVQSISNIGTFYYIQLPK